MERKRVSSRLSPALRKTIVVFHSVLGIGWMGVDIALFVLLLHGRSAVDAAEAAGSYRAIAVVVPAVVPALSVGVLVTGILLGWGTAWGLLRYWWVFLKLVLSMVMTVMVYVGLVPAVQAIPTVSGLATGNDVRARLGELTTQLFFPPCVSFGLLAIATVLSVFKPRWLTPWTRTAA